MGDNQLIPVSKNSLRIFKKETVNYSTPIMTYCLVDPLHYSFTYDFNDSIHFRMDESEQANKKSDFIVPMGEKSQCDNSI